MNTSNKTGSKFLVANDNQHGYSSDEDNTARPFVKSEFMAIQEANEEEEESNTETDEGNFRGTINQLTESKDDASYESDENDDDDEHYGLSFLHNNVVCSTQDKTSIPKNWILLDSQSTLDVFSNAGLLVNILDVKTVLMLNAGKAIVTQKGDPKGIPNILSLHKAL